jgi:uncharacterized protein
MPERLNETTIFETPEAALERYIALSAARTEPVPVDSEEGRALYRTLARWLWNTHHRAVDANDIRALWQRIDTLKRGSPVTYEIGGIHFWAADFANAQHAAATDLSPESNQHLAAWLDDWPNVCLLGQTGRGKSTTVNRLFGAKMAETSHHKACTSTVTDYRLVTGQFLGRPTGITLWDVPGYGDDRMPWNAYVKLYRKLSKKCDVVIFMFDHERTLPEDLDMFKKIRKKAGDDRKLVVCINKADLFFPGDWDSAANAPGPQMAQTIGEHIGIVAQKLGLADPKQVLSVSALKGWNMLALINALVRAAGETRAPQLLRALRSVDTEPQTAAEKEMAERFGVSDALRKGFRKKLKKRRAD